MDDDVFVEKADEEFDEQIFGGIPSNQPLTLRVRRIRNRGVLVIYWEVANWLGWENPILFGRKYENHITTNMVNESEAENPSKPIVSGSLQRVGTTGELRLEAGQTTYFGFWLKGRTIPEPKGLKWPDWVEWNSPTPIAFPVYMPLWAESLQTLRERRDKEHLKREIRNILRAQQEKPKAEQEIPKRDPAMEKIRELMEMTERQEDLLKLLHQAAEKEQAKLNDLEAKVSRGEMNEDLAEELRFEYQNSYSNIRGLIRTYMTGEPQA